MNAADADAFARRFRRVLDYVDSHLDQDLTVERLSSVASFSKYHFHRQFSELFGISAYKYVQLVRLKRASYELAFRRDHRIIDIALASGYDSHEAFSRAFKKVVGQTPSDFREQPRWPLWHETYQPIKTLRLQHMTSDIRLQDVTIVDFPETRVAVLEHRGAPSLIGDSIRRFIDWRKQNKLPPSVSATFNLFYDNPDDTPPDDYRLDLCAATDRGVSENPFGVVEKTIPAGRCALLRHVGSDDTLKDTITYLYATWLPASGEEPRDFPLYVQRVHFFPDVPENETIVDIFLPLK